MELIFQSIFKSPKTTITPIISGVVWVLGQYNILVTPEQAAAIGVILLMLLGFLAKDSTATHTEK